MQEECFTNALLFNPQLPKEKNKLVLFNYGYIKEEYKNIGLMQKMFKTIH